MLRNISGLLAVGLWTCACAALLGIERGDEGPTGAGGSGADGGMGGRTSSQGGGGDDGWPDGAWQQRRTLTIDTLSWPEGPFEGFPIGIPLPEDVSEETSQDEVLFTLPDGTVVPHELEHGAANITAWLRLPALSPPESVGLVLYEGGARSASPTEVWTGDYEGVWHFDADFTTPPFAVPDSSDNGYHATPSGTAEHLLGSGVIGHALTLLGDVEESFGVEDDPRLAMGVESFTVSAWIFPRTSTAFTPTVIFRGGANPNPGYQVFRENDTGVWKLRLADGPQARTLDFSDSLEGQWTHIAFVVDRTANEARTFVNATATDTSAIDMLGSLDGDFHLEISRKVNQPYTGDIDELRIERTARSAAWIELMYASMQDIEGRVDVGPVELPPSP